MLTGHTKKLFEEWYEKQYYPLAGTDAKILRLASLWKVPFEGIMGYYLEFLREQGISANVWQDVQTEKFNYTVFTEQEYYGKECPDYNTALTQAIEKCNEIINGSIT